LQDDFEQSEEGGGQSGPWWSRRLEIVITTILNV